MKIEVRRKGPIEILDIKGKLDTGKGDAQLRETFRNSLDAGQQMFIFNFSATPFVDTSGLGEIVACTKRARERHGTIKLVVPRKSKVRDVIVITMLDRAFEMFTDEEEAIASFIGETAIT